MAVDPLGSIDPVTGLKGIDRTTATPPSNAADSVTLSPEARSVGDLYAAVEIAHNSPDVRADLVADVKARLASPDYVTAAVIDRVAERVQDPVGT